MSRTRVRAAMMFAFRKFLLCGLGGQSFSLLGCEQRELSATFQRSLALSQLRRLLSNSSGIDYEFERIRILVLLHELEVDEPSGVGYGGAALNLFPDDSSSEAASSYLPSAAKRSTVFTSCLSDTPR